MRIQYSPQHEQGEIVHALSGLTWKPGEIREIGKDARIRYRRRDEDGTSYVCYVNLIEDILSNPNFKNANTGVNYRFLCDGCGAETLTDYYQHPKTRNMVENNFDGKRLCEPCFDSARKNITPDSIEIYSSESPKEL